MKPLVARIGFCLFCFLLVLAALGCGGTPDDVGIVPEATLTPVVAEEIPEEIVNPVPSETAVATETPVLSAPTEVEVLSAPAEVQVLSIQIVESRPHASDAFTQGFEFFEGKLFESRGLYGESGVSEINPSNGELMRWLPLENQFFGEGLTVVGDTLIQLTWRNGVANVIDIDSFTIVDVFNFEGEGWGLCFDGEVLYMSDGSSRLTIRDPRSFLIVDEITVTRDGVPVTKINELECVGEDIYANVWRTNDILVIDRSSGNVRAAINASGLLTVEESESADVLNGIAYLEESGTFLITGKLWPVMFEVTFE